MQSIEELRAKHATYMREYRKRNPDAARLRDRIYRSRYPEKVRENNLKYGHGITPHDWDELNEQQGGVCAICGDRERSRRGRLHIDHDHRTGKIRALLCSRCNCGLGAFGDDQSLMKLAIEYLSER